MGGKGPGNTDARAACHRRIGGVAKRFPHERFRTFVGRPYAPILAFHSFMLRRGSRSHRRDLKEYLGALLDQVLSRCSSGLPLPHVLIEAAAASERKPSSRDLEPVDGAVHLAGAAREPPDAVHLRCAECHEIDGVARCRAGPFQGQEPDSQCSEQFGAGWDHDLATDTVGEGVSDGAVQRDTALEKNFLPDIARPLDAIQIIAGNGIHQPGDDIVAGMPLLLSEANVGIDEGRAGRLELHGRRSGQRQIGDVRDRDAEIAVGALLQEGAGAGRTGVIHRIVDGHTVTQIDVLGVLPSDLENGVHLRIEMGCACRLGRNLIVDVLRPEIGTGKFPGRSGCADQSDRAIPHLLDEGLEALAGGRHRIALRTPVI